MQKKKIGLRKRQSFLRREAAATAMVSQQRSHHKRLTPRVSVSTVEIAPSMCRLAKGKRTRVFMDKYY